MGVRQWDPNQRFSCSEEPAPGGILKLWSKVADEGALACSRSLRHLTLRSSEEQEDRVLLISPQELGLV